MHNLLDRLLRFRLHYSAIQNCHQNQKLFIFKNKADFFIWTALPEFMQSMYFWEDWHTSQNALCLNIQNVFFSLLINDISAVVYSLFRHFELGWLIWQITSFLSLFLNRQLLYIFPFPTLHISISESNHALTVKAESWSCFALGYNWMSCWASCRQRDSHASWLGARDGNFPQLTRITDSLPAINAWHQLQD